MEVRTFRPFWTHVYRLEMELSQRQLRRKVVVADQRSQAHRAFIPGRGDAVLFHRRRGGGDLSHRALDSAGRSGAGRDLQQAVHHARHHHDFFVFDPGDSRGLGKFPGADDVGRARSRLSPVKSGELVRVCHRRAVPAGRHARRRRRYRMDVLHALQHGLQQQLCHRYRPRRLHRRLFLDHDRAQFRRDHPHHARPWADLVSFAAIYLVALCDQRHHIARHPGAGDHHRAVGPRAAARLGDFQSRIWAAIRFYFNTCSGFIPIRRSTS